jgi:hypothetical protein
MGFDFWSVKEFNLAPLESINYVIKFVSGQFVGRDPARYGLELGDAGANTYPRAESHTQCSDGSELMAGP